MISPARLQGYLRQNARKQYERVSLPPFSLFFHQTDPLSFFNYAIPDAPVSAVHHAVLVALQEEFVRRARQPRFEFIEEYSPDLPSILRAKGYVEEARQLGMVCTPLHVRSAPFPAGLVILPLTRTSPTTEARAYVTIQHRGFDSPGGAEASDQQAQQLLDDLHGGRAFVARWHGEPVGVGMYTTPIDGITELVGIATLPEFRRRGIGTAIVGEALRSAFARGVEAVYLTAADEKAGRLYAQVGFRARATMLAYHDGSDE